MSYLMAQDTLNGAEGKITITRNGRILEAAGMRNIKTIAGIQTSDMKTIGTRTVQKRPMVSRRPAPAMSTLVPTAATCSPICCCSISTLV